MHKFLTKQNSVILDATININISSFRHQFNKIAFFQGPLPTLLQLFIFIETTASNMNEVIDILVKKNLVDNLTSRCNEKTDKNKKKYVQLSLDNYQDQYLETETEDQSDVK